MDKVYAVGKALPEFDAMFEIVFPSTGFGGYLFKNWHDRERTAHEIQPEVFGAVSQIKELQIFPCFRRRCRVPATSTSNWC